MSCKNWFKHLLLYLYHKWKNRHNVRFSYSAQMSHRCEFEGMNLVSPHTSFYGKLGFGSSIGHHCNISADVGRFSSIAPHTTYINGFHPYKEPFVTTSSLFYSLNPNKTPHGEVFAKRQMLEEFRYFDKDRKIVNKIGNDVWIGADVCLIGGIEIGDGAVILSRAVVTKNIPAYAIAGGIPARIIGYRYDEDTINLLKEVKWWDMDRKWLKDNWFLLCDIEDFKYYFKKQRKQKYND